MKKADHEWPALVLVSGGTYPALVKPVSGLLSFFLMSSNRRLNSSSILREVRTCAHSAPTQKDMMLAMIIALVRRSFSEMPARSLLTVPAKTLTATMRRKLTTLMYFISKLLFAGLYRTIYGYISLNSTPFISFCQLFSFS